MKFTLVSKISDVLEHAFNGGITSDNSIISPPTDPHPPYSKL